MTKQTHIVTLNSYDEFVEYVSTKLPVWMCTHESKSTRAKSTMSDSYQDALDLAINGWPNGRNLMTEIMDEINIPTLRVETANELTFDITGERPDIARAVAGDPANMISETETERPSKILRVYVASGFRSDVSAKQVMTRGAAIISYIDALENAGWRCEIVALNHAIGNSETFITQIIIKEPEAILDIDRIAFCFAHPSFHRRLNFRIKETVATAEYEFSGSYGSSIDIKPLDSDIYIPPFETNSLSAATDMVQGIIDNTKIV